MYRRHLKHSRVKNLFKFVSAKMNQVLTVESYLEFDTCFHLEYSLSITSFIAQPEGFTYRFEDRELPYTPDFQVIENKNLKWIEVKPSRKTQNLEFLARFRAKQAKAQQIGVPLLLVTEKQVRVNPVLNNLKIIHRYSGLQSLDSIHLRLLSLIQSVGKIRVSDAANRLGIEQAHLLKYSLSLLASGVLSADLSGDELGVHSVLWRK